MDLKSLIAKRRSVRHYTKQEVKSWIIGEILDSARYAPSAGNAQNWRFIVVRDPNVKTKITDASLKQYWMNTAPVFIVVCSDGQKLKALYKKRGELYATQNCSIAATYMMLRAVDLGLGTCWVGAFDEKKVADILKLEKGVEPQVILTLGYPVKEVKKKHFRHDIDKLVFFEGYKNRIGNPPQRLADMIKKGIKKLKKS